jgi:hypothetical protein
VLLSIMYGLADASLVAASARSLSGKLTHL